MPLWGAMPRSASGARATYFVSKRSSTADHSGRGNFGGDDQAEADWRNSSADPDDDNPKSGEESSLYKYRWLIGILALVGLAIGGAIAASNTTGSSTPADPEMAAFGAESVATTGGSGFIASLPIELMIVGGIAIGLAMVALGVAAMYRRDEKPVPAVSTAIDPLTLVGPDVTLGSDASPALRHSIPPTATTEPGTPVTGQLDTKFTAKA